MPEYTPEQIDARIEADTEMRRLATEDPTEFLAQHQKLYHTFGYNPDGSPMRTAKKLIGKAARATGLPEGLVHGVVAAPLEVAGTVAGISVGRAGGPVGAMIGAAGGNILGSAVNSLLGISDPMTKMDMTVAGGAPLIGPAVARAGQGLVKLGKRLIPGGGAGMNELAAEQFKARLSSMRVLPEHVQEARKLIDTVDDFRVPVSNLKKLFAGESKDLVDRQVAGSPVKQSYLDEVNTVIESNPELNSLVKGSSMSFKRLMTLEEGFNAIKGQRPGELWAKASGVIIDEMEAALKNPALAQGTRDKTAAGLNAFKQFIQTNRKYHADEAILNAMKVDGSVIKTVANDTDLVLFDQKAFKKFLGNEDLNKAFSPAEIESMRESVSSLGYISRPPSTSGDVFNMAKRFGAGGTIGWMTAGPMGAAVGAGIEEVIRKAVTTEPGRQAMKYLAKKGRGRIDALELDTMLGKIVAGMGATVPGVTGRGYEQNQE